MQRFVPVLRLSIRQRIFGGFGVILVLSGVLAAVSVQGGRVIDGQVARSTAAAEAALATEEFAGQLKELNYRTTRYALTGTDDDLQRASAQLGRTAESLDSMAARLKDGGTDTVAAFTAYRRGAEATFAAVKLRLAGAEDLKKSGTALGNITAAVLARVQRDGRNDLVEPAVRLDGALQSSLVGATRFLYSLNPADADTAKLHLANLRKEAEAIAAAVGDNAKLQRFSEAMTPLIADYGKAVDALVAATDGFVAANKAREEAADQLVGKAEGLKRANVAANAAAVRAASDSLGGIRTLNIDIAGLVLVIGIALAYIIGRGIAQPVRRITATMQALAGGELEIVVPHDGRRDEIGDMARAVLVFKDNALEVRRLAAQQEALEAEAEAGRRRAMHELAAHFEETVSGVVATVTAASEAVRRNAESMTALAGGAIEESRAVGGASEKMAGDVQTVAAATEELTISFAEVGRSVAEASQIARAAVGDAAQTSRSIAALAEAAQRIGGVVTLIQGVAKQTNLLALNATIEASRAGEAGRGFAVVANEVKGLAGQTAKATEEIAAQIAGVQQASEAAVGAIGRIVATIERMDGVSTAMSAAIEEQQGSTREIARSVQQAAAETEQVSGNIGNLAAAARDTGAAADAVLGAARDLAREADRLRRDVATFLEKVRAA